MRLKDRSVCWPAGRSSPQITLPKDQCELAGIEHADSVPVTYDRESGELTFYLKDGEASDA